MATRLQEFYTKTVKPQLDTLGLPVEVVEGGLSDRTAVERGVSGCRYVFHVAADYRIWVPEPEAMYRANVDGLKIGPTSDSTYLFNVSKR